MSQILKRMFRASHLVSALIGAAAIIICVMAPAMPSSAETIALSCSAQVYEAFQSEGIKAFTDKTGIKVDVDVFPSAIAVTRLANEQCDFATTAQSLTARLRHEGYMEIPFCKDALQIIANAKVTVPSLTADQVRGIFSGAITNWKEVGGPDERIFVIVPSSETAAFKNFSRMFLMGQDMEYDIMTSKSTTVVEATRRFPWSLSFATKGAAFGNLAGTKAIRVNGLAPTDANYPFSQVFSFVTKGEPTGAVKKFIDFFQTGEGAKIITSRGMTSCKK
jgi:phosphate transport system substrate-binding protein